MDSGNKLKMCRLCLCENECFVNIFKVNDWHSFVAAEVISDLLGLQVSKTDCYPDVVCSPCLTKLTIFKIFREQCHASMVTYDKTFSRSPAACISETANGAPTNVPEKDPLSEDTGQVIYHEIKQESVDIMENGDGFLQELDQELKTESVDIVDNVDDYSEMEENTEEDSLEGTLESEDMQTQLELDAERNSMEERLTDEQQTRKRRVRPSCPCSDSSSLSPPVDPMRRKLISLDTKLKIIQRLEAGMSSRSLAREFKVTDSSVYRIKCMAEKIKESIPRSNLQSAKMMAKVKSSLVRKLEKDLCAWLEEQRGRPGYLVVRDKALSLYKRLEEDGDVEPTGKAIQENRDACDVSPADEQEPNNGSPVLPQRLVERHFSEKIPQTGKKIRPQRRCAVCTSNKRRKDTIYWCPSCRVGLCMGECFKIYHTRLIF